jgi:Mycothiol maleylpyruvate isomerase N-terminal domain
LPLATLCVDLRAEDAALDRLVAELGGAAWNHLPPFHGWTVYDQIAHLGGSTFPWTFQNRKLEVPDVRPAVVLAAPSGAT